MEQYRSVIDEALRAFLKKQPANDMYKHMEYFLGFRDENLRPTETITGKRFRPILSLLLADGFGSQEAVLPAALSIELFHNFSLIHDDIVDNDTMRRGRKTLWQVFGKHHAINSGDAQLLLAIRALVDDEKIPLGTRSDLQRYLFKQYQTVAEGQALDFFLAENMLDNELVTEDTYQEMITKKTAVLIGASAAVAGIAHDLPEAETNLLYEYGVALGLGYQLLDDYQSLWGEEGETGKRSLGDVYEKKKTLPVIHTYQKATSTERSRLNSLYINTEEIDRVEATEILKLVEKSESKKYLQEKINRQIKQVQSVRSKLHLKEVTDRHLQKLESRLLST